MAEFTKEWLRSAIEGMETNRELFPGDLDDNHGKVLSALKMALAVMDAGREELQEYRKAAGERVVAPDAWLWRKNTGHLTAGMNRPMYEPLYSAAIPLYTTPQPAPAVEAVPVVVKDHQIRELVNELRDIAVEYHGTHQLRERIASTVRAAMQQPVSNRDELPGWIKCSERNPEEGGRYWCYVEEQNSLGKSHYQWNCSWNGDVWSDAALTGRVTHWQPLAAAPQQE
ncbi:DUF551 domain-containing protein [Scandinavium manionii]|uniref:DUF551 domain-containing protein n=1 Tax=Scandinavium manionii TaxID=2926520 RepID=UPI0021650058|nr:DUF551 domain-containing protein [Scandinavium manionii]MCS2167570.1 DUF551 domain-containing protein [Scandinavium manionii]